MHRSLIFVHNVLYNVDNFPLNRANTLKVNGTLCSSLSTQLILKAKFNVKEYHTQVVFKKSDRQNKKKENKKKIRTIMLTFRLTENTLHI